MVTIFNTRYTFYKIDVLKSDFLIGYNLLKKIGAAIDTEKGVIRYGGKEEKLIYDNDSSFNQLSLSEEKTILPLKEFIMSLKRQIKAKQVWDLNIMNTPSLKYLTKLQVWDSKILSAPSLKYPTKFQVWD